MRKIILDVDTGTDDAIAIMCALQSGEFDVAGICTVNGNRGVEYTTENTCRLLEYLGREEIPVYKGAPLPLVATLDPWRRPGMPFGGKKKDGPRVHSDWLDLPPSVNKKPEEMDAVSYYLKALSGKEKITLVEVGPLTNLALALRAKPEIAQNIEEIVIMGGAYANGNTSPAAEFNWWCDPESAKIVMDCGAKITIIPLNATHMAGVSRQQADALAASGTKAGMAAAKFIKHRLDAVPDSETTAVHDALALLYLLDKDVCADVKPMYVDVDFSGGGADGMSIVDVDKRYYDRQPNCDFAFGADREKFSNLLTDILTKK